MYTSITARICEPDETKCADNYQCLNKDNFCNGYTDCNDESDEDAVACKGIFCTFNLMYRYI